MHNNSNSTLLFSYYIDYLLAQFMSFYMYIANVLSVFLHISKMLSKITWNIDGKIPCATTVVINAYSIIYYCVGISQQQNIAV